MEKLATKRQRFRQACGANGGSRLHSKMRDSHGQDLPALEELLAKLPGTMTVASSEATL